MSTTNARKAEALGQSVTVEYGGNTYTVPPSDEWPVDVFEAIDDQQFTKALRALLGANQWATFKATKPKVRQLGELFEAVSGAVGAGNS